MIKIGMLLPYEDMLLIAKRVYEATDESIRAALTAAADLARVAESEKLNTAQFETVLDTSFNGIIKLNTAGNIIVINKMIENFIGKDEEEVVGLPVEEILPNVDRSRIESILEGKSESYVSGLFTSLDKGTQPFVVCDG